MHVFNSRCASWQKGTVNKIRHAKKKVARKKAVYPSNLRNDYAPIEFKSQPVQLPLSLMIATKLARMVRNVSKTVLFSLLCSAVRK